MKLLRYDSRGQEKPGLLDAQGRIRSLEGVVPDIGGQVLTPEGIAALRGVDPNTLPLVEGAVRIGPCVAGTGKFICTGLNYPAPAAGAGAARRGVDPTPLPLVEGAVRIGPCVAGTGKFICIGLNYSDHAAETGATVPPEPIIFMKATSAICGPNDDVEIPRNSAKTDWEVELGVVIGRHAKYIDEADALSHVAGNCPVNDGAARA